MTIRKKDGAHCIFIGDDMPTLEEVYHKGSWCIYDLKTLCQEGFCSECKIYKDKMDLVKRLLDNKGVSATG